MLSLIESIPLNDSSPRWGQALDAVSYHYAPMPRRRVLCIPLVFVANAGSASAIDSNMTFFMTSSGLTREY